MEENNVIICDCGSMEHQIIIVYDNYPEKLVFLQTHLTTYRNFFKRVIVAVKYIFGYKCKYGHWDSIIISEENYKPLKDIVEYLEK